MIYGTILIILAMLPGFFLMYKTYVADRIEKEPKRLIFLLMILGAVSAFPAIALELVAEAALKLFYQEGSIFYLILENFLGVALIEELCKYTAGRIPTWKSKHFDFKFDGMVYMVASAVGFAVFENILYVLGGGISVAIMRAFLSIPAHVTCGVFMGMFYGKAKYADAHGQVGKRQKYTFFGFLVPVVIHGFDDLCLSMGSLFVLFVYAIFLMTIYAYAYMWLKQFSREDTRIIDFEVPETENLL